MSVFIEFPMPRATFAGRIFGRLTCYVLSQRKNAPGGEILEAKKKRQKPGMLVVEHGTTNQV